MRCGSRVKSKCPGCAELYRGDWAAIARSGVFDGPVEQFAFYFLTLTAPSFGATHHVPNVAKGKTSVKRPCACGIWHTAADAGLLGVAVDPSGYDYAGQAAWNRDNGVLWTNTVRRLRDRWPEVEFFIVREVQARGVLHTHVLVRIPRPHAPSSEALLEAALSATGFSKVDGGFLEWGQSGADCQPIRVSVDGSQRIWYVSKALNYVLKDIAIAAGEGESLELWHHLSRLDLAARAMQCDRNCTPAECRRKVHRSFGMRSHVVSQSRRTKTRPGWSFTGLNRTVQRRLRLEWFLSQTSGATEEPIKPDLEQVGHQAEKSQLLLACTRGSSP